jgi:hypothetical protein
MPRGNDFNLNNLADKLEVHQRPVIYYSGNPQT